MPAALLLAGGCAVTEVQPAQLQLDIDAPQPQAAATVRLCVLGVGQREVGARDTWRYAYPGLPAGVPASVVVDALDQDGQVLARASVDALSGWALVPLDDCGAAGCEPCTAASGGDPEDASWLLAARFSG